MGSDLDEGSDETAKWVGLVTGPLLFAIFLVFNPFSLADGGDKVVAVFAWMLIWWITEAVPLPVTALLPMVLFTLTGVMPLKEAVIPYSNPVIYLFFGGFVLAIGLEEHNLHKRIALAIIGITGLSPPRLILGFMIASTLISMWISNTATTVMMLPMALSVIALLDRDSDGSDDHLRKRFATALVLTIAYSATIGGMGTVIGTPPNVVMRGYFSEKLGYDIPFFTWMLWAMPVVLVLSVIFYVMLVFVLFPIKGLKIDRAEAMFADERKKLGAFTLPQYWMLGIFAITATAWITRDLVVHFFPSIQWTDETIALIAAITVFTIPTSRKKYQPLLGWDAMKRLPWGILLLFGGGFSLADGFERTGVLSVLANQFAGLGQGHVWLTILLLAILAVYVSEIMSNVALVSLLVPIVAGIAIGMGVDPIELAFPVTLAASCGFMLPMATPPNAIVFASGHVTIRQMFWAGFWLDIISVAVVVALT